MKAITNGNRIDIDESLKSLRELVDDRIDEAMRLAAALQVQDFEGKFSPALLKAAFGGIAKHVGHEVRSLCRQAREEMDSGVA